MLWFLPIGTFLRKYEIKLEMAMCGWNVCDVATREKFTSIDWISPSSTLKDTIEWLNKGKTKLIHPPKRSFDVIAFKNKMNLRGWGYTDSRVSLEKNGFFFHGDRYVNVSNNPLPKFKGFCNTMVPGFDDKGVRNVVVDLKPTDEQTRRDESRKSIVQSALYHVQQHADLEANTDYIVRVNGSHGQELTEIHTNIHNSFNNIADMVVFPETRQSVVDLIIAARSHDIILIPFGGGTNGGTNVSRCLEIPDHCMDRVVCVVNMTAYCSVEWIDKTNMMACVQAGATGDDLELELGKYNVMFGHQPDSCEFSTMGGWVSTNASGMKKNRYGNIEDNVISVEWVDGNGNISTNKNYQRTAIGPNSAKMMFGSEGNFGIILSCVISIGNLPEKTDYDSWVFPNMKKGIQFMKDVSETDSWPASLRLMNNEQFRLGQAFKPPASKFKALIDPILKFVLTRVKGFDLMEMAASTVVYEGSKEQIALQKRIISRCAGKYGGMSGGSSSGKDGYNVTFAIAYIRDCLYKYGIMGETIECSVSWRDLNGMLDGVTREFHDMCDKRGITDRFFCYRVSQIYKEGVCVYCTFGLPLDDTKRDIGIFAGIERETRLSILRYGGSLSHHHGIGKLRAEFIHDEFDESEIDVMTSIKSTVDPKNIFANGNGIFAA
jgi:alkyldihydroxyacetonephosphate synthase